MLTKQVMLTSALTLACALGIGVYMQAFGTDREAGSALKAAAAGAELPSEPSGAELQIEKIALTSANPASARESADHQSSEPEPESSCRMTAAAKAAPLAMVAFSVDAACRANERLTVHHSGMSFTVSLDEAGRYEGLVPALTQTAVFIAEISGGAGAVAVVEVPDIGAVERVVVQWSGHSGIELHAREFGAAYGSAGHVWHGAGNQAGIGRVMRLGDESQLAPRIAEMYSLPSSLPGQDGRVSLTAEAEITARNCGRDIYAQALQLHSGRLSNRDLVMAMPDCDAQGSFLVLNNLMEDLKIAAN